MIISSSNSSSSSRGSGSDSNSTSSCDSSKYNKYKSGVKAGAMVGKYNLRPGPVNEFFLVRVSKHTLGARVGKCKFGQGPVNTDLAPGSVNTNWEPGPANSSWGPKPVNNWEPGSGAGRRAWKYKHPL